VVDEEPWPLVLLFAVVMAVVSVVFMIGLFIAACVSALFGRTQWLTRLFDDRPEPYRPIDVGKD
jgi:non-ribosomal peptide synthetase component F